ncbi:CcmD family protein [Salibacter halophilus]|uniref:CcmD family protein n=1 Tax=Salibacter halophilus TaxID=1803916 RepID=A0A6N6M9Y2_9FLAO|nr:CcmD family protein [Salibacter halophilus]KAB1065961.1 CcmD family protein [Salibacter halophilus]
MNFKGTAILALILSLFSAVSVRAQQGVEMADTMRSEGKIYIVVAVIAIIFIGIVIYMISLDRKLSKLEKELRD